MHVGAFTMLPKINITWPHQVAIGYKCVLENDIYFKYDGIWQNGPNIKICNQVFIGRGCEFNINCGITINDYANIASGCKFIDHDHGTAANERIGAQSSKKAAIFIGQDAWLGFNVIVLKGVIIGKGSVIAAGAVVTKSVPDNEIWAGIPARKIGVRS